MKKFIKLCIALSAVCVFLSSCDKPDSDKIWGNTYVYMPQATYDPYVVPNSGHIEQNNLNYSVDEENGILNIFLGVYRSGLQPLEEYSVNIDVENTAIKGTSLLPAANYDLPVDVTCPAGKRDATFYLSVDLEFLKANKAKDFSLTVCISSPTRYELNESLCKTVVRINTSELLTKVNC